MDLTEIETLITGTPGLTLQGPAAALIAAHLKPAIDAAERETARQVWHDTTWAENDGRVSEAYLHSRNPYGPPPDPA